MTVDTTLDQLEHLIDEERAAIRNIEVDRLEGFAERKLLLMQALLSSGLTDRTDLTERFKSCVDELRQNGILLAHARNCVRDVIQIVAAPSAAYDPKGQSSVPRMSRGRLSVTG